MNGIRYYPNFGSVRTVNFTCDVYANDSLHGVCFPTGFLYPQSIETYTEFLLFGGYMTNWGEKSSEELKWKCCDVHNIQQICILLVWSRDTVYKMAATLDSHCEMYKSRFY